DIRDTADHGQLRDGCVPRAVAAEDPCLLLGAQPRGRQISAEVSRPCAAMDGQAPASLRWNRRGYWPISSLLPRAPRWLDSEARHMAWVVSSSVPRLASAAGLAGGP